MARRRRGSIAGTLDDARLTGPRVITRGGPIPDQPSPPPEPEPAPANPEVNSSDVAILLPLRMETLFTETDAGWRLRLRLIPDEASIRRDQRRVTPDERQALETLWAEALAAQPDLTSPPHTWLQGEAAALAWMKFARRVGAPRAAELVGAFPPGPDGRVNVPEASVGDPEPERVGGWPEAVEIHAVFAGDPEPQLLGTLQVDPEALKLALPSEPEEERHRWWVDWEAAQAAGFGLDIALPGGLGPDELLELYAVGLSQEHPAEHFAALAAAGQLAVLPLGVPTNSVHGAPAADLATNDPDWLTIARRRLNGDTHRPLSRSLTGDDFGLPAVPEALPLAPNQFAPFHSVANELVKGLWPALWGHSLEDVWARGDDAQAIWRWAFDWLHPEGPLPPIRIGAQPYGLLPVSALRRWQADALDQRDAPIEVQLAHRLANLLVEWARSAPPNVVKASHAVLMDLLGRDGVTRHYAYRQFLPADFFALLYSSDAGSLSAFQETVARYYEPAIHAHGQPPARQYLTHQPQFDLQLPLVQPTHWPVRYGDGGTGEAPMPNNAFEAMLRDILAFGHSWSRLREAFQARLPNSLLVRLIIYANLRAAANVVRVNTGDFETLLESMVEFNIEGGLVAHLAEFLEDHHEHTPGPVLDQYHAVRQALGLMSIWYQQPEDLERALRATLDTASYRLDPWIIGLAWRRLQRLQAAPDTRVRLGVYGWLEGPFQGTPGPTEGGVLHAPSYAQALTSAILRDKQLAERHEPGNQNHNPWDLRIDSRLARQAEELAEETRLGAHIWDAIGRRVEAIMQTRENVLALRAAFPLRPGKPDRNVVCNGQAALRALLHEPNPPVATTPEQRDALEVLERTLDAYADLLVAEAAFQVVSGEASTAGAVMDAAAGLAMPPPLDVLKTRRQGYGLTTSILGVLPARSAADLAPDAGPAALADPSVAAFLEQSVGPAAAWTWQAEGGQRASLSDVGLEPIDAALLAEGLLEEIFGALLGAPLDAQPSAGRDRHRRARQLLGVLGAEPALLADLAPQDANRAALAGADAAMIQELAQRLSALQDRAAATLEALQAAGADGNATRAALRAALRWGIVPFADPQERAAGLAMLFGTPPETDTELLGSLVQRAASTLQRRMEAVSQQLTSVAEASPTGAVAVQSLTRAIAELAAPDGRLAILGKLPAAALRAAANLNDTAPDTTLDSDWLVTVAAVRQPLAALEAMQIEAELQGGFDALSAWSSAPGDPWQLEVAAHNARVRSGQAAPGEALKLPRLVVAYGPPDAWTEVVAVSRIDHWTEMVPFREHVSTAAFGFNAPSAQAPQAILLAVPPDLGTPLTNESLLDILRETRLLARARAANADDLGRFQPLRATLLPASGRSAVPLDPGLLYPE